MFYNAEILSEDFEQAKGQWGHQLDKAFPTLKARSGRKERFAAFSLKKMSVKCKEEEFAFSHTPAPFSVHSKS